MTDGAGTCTESAGTLESPPTEKAREVACRLCGSRFYIGGESKLESCPECHERNFRFTEAGS